MIRREDAPSAPILRVSPVPTAAELAAILAVLSSRPAGTGGPPAEATRWRDAARRAAVHRDWPRPVPDGWARTARREMQHAEHG